MSTSLLYHAFGVRGYDHVRTEYRGGEVYFTVEQPKGKLRCSGCGSRGVIRIAVEESHEVLTLDQNELPHLLPGGPLFQRRELVFQRH